MDGTLGDFTRSLGFFRGELKRGTFSDHHEDFVEDRAMRFLPAYNSFWQAGPSTFKHGNGTLSVDMRPRGPDGNDLGVSHRKHVYEIAGRADASGRRINKRIDLGGILPADGLVPLLVSHDESCFAAGEVSRTP